MGLTRVELVGRAPERAAIERLLDGGGARALVLRGDAGIGKTALWLRIVDEARARGYSILEAHPAMSEATLSYAALTDLIGPVRLIGRPVRPQDGASSEAVIRARGMAEAVAAGRR